MKNAMPNKNNIGLSTWSLLPIKPFEALDKIYKLGFRRVELFGLYPHFWPRTFLKNKTLIKKLKKSLKRFDGENSIHAPLVNLTHNNEGLREESFRQVKETIILAAGLRIKYVVTHPGKKTTPMQTWDYNNEIYASLIDYLKELAGFARAKRVYLCLENVCDDFGFDHKEMLTILKRVNSPNIGVTFDIGHANLAGADNINKTFNALKGHIKVIHISDNFGKYDEHLPVGRGNIKFCEFLYKNKKYIKNIKFTGEFGFNKKRPYYAATGYLNFMRNMGIGVGPDPL